METSSVTPRVRTQPKVRHTDASTLKAPYSSTWFSSPFFENFGNFMDGSSPGAVVCSKLGFSIQHFCVGTDSIFPRAAHDLAKAAEVKLMEFGNRERPL